MNSAYWFFVSWVVFGAIGFPFIKYQIDGQITLGDLLLGMFLGAIGGYAALIVGVLCYIFIKIEEHDLFKKVVFKKNKN